MSTKEKEKSSLITIDKVLIGTAVAAVVGISGAFVGASKGNKLYIDFIKGFLEGDNKTYRRCDGNGNAKSFSKAFLDGFLLG